MHRQPTVASGPLPVRVLVVDDQRLVRAALRAAVGDADDLLVVGETADADACLRLCRSAAPDVALVDLSGPGHPEVDLTRRLTIHHPAVQVVVVTAAVDGERVRRALDAGAVGYLVKDAEPRALRDGVRAVARGESPLDPRAVRAMLRVRPSARGEDLTAREREVLALLARGLANKQIARELQISDSTVKAHVGSIFGRIGVADRTSAAVWAEHHLPAVLPAPRAEARGPWTGRVASAPRAGTPATDRSRAWTPAVSGGLQPASA